MAGKWPTVCIEDIAEKIAMGPFGSSIKVETFVPKGIPVISGAHLHGTRLEDGEYNFVSLGHADKLKNANVFRGDVIFTHAGNIGQAAYIPENSLYDRYVISQRQFYLRCDRSKVQPEFVAYYFKSRQGRHKLLANASQVGVPSIARPSSYLKTIEIQLPPLGEQQAIAHILGTLDDKIELNRRMNETLEAIARAMFKSWFVDFDLVRAKMSGEPSKSICQRLGLTPELLALFPDRLVDSELGEIPQGWHVGTIADHCKLNAESWSAKTIPNQVHYVDLANVKSGIISEVQIFSSETAPSRARRILRAGDTIIGTVRPGNRSFALIGDGDVQLTGSTGFAVLSPKRRELREWVFFLATSDENIDRLSRLADGAAYPAVRPEVVVAGECLIPNSKVIDAFHEATASMFDYQIANRINGDALASVRDVLLPKLLSGELRVSATGDA